MAVRRSTPALAPLAVLLAACGCSDKPKAPPLVRETVYQNDGIGLRFLTPDGWINTSRAWLPPGPLAKPVVLTAYAQPGGESPTELEVVAADRPIGSDERQFLADYRLGPETWTLGPAEPVTVNGVSATRVVSVRGTGADAFRREATAFRRGERLYVFFITYGANDPEHRDQARQSIESATWDK